MKWLLLPPADCLNKTQMAGNLCFISRWLDADSMNHEPVVSFASYLCPVAFA
jgi:hypothetical protein